MNRRYLRAVVAGLIETPAELRAVIEPLKAVTVANKEPPIGWEAQHSTGKRCGHLHRDHGKACAYAARLGCGWSVVLVNR